MKKILFPLVVLAISSLNALAQVKPAVHFSIGGEYGLTTGAPSNVYGSVIGGSLKLELPVASSNFNVTATAGFTEYALRLTYDGPADPLGFVPLELGGKYYLSKLFYLEGNVGASINVSGSYGGKKAALVYAPIIGFSAPTSSHKASIDLGLRYEARVENGNTLGQIALRLAYRFGPTYPADPKKQRPRKPAAGR